MIYDFDLYFKYDSDAVAFFNQIQLCILHLLNFYALSDDFYGVFCCFFSSFSFLVHIIACGIG